MTAADLAAWRKARSLTQGEAAKLLGVSRLTWQSWELGRRKPDRFKLDAIARLRPARTEGDR